MKKLILFFVLFSQIAFSAEVINKDSIANLILKEGKLLYHLEKASWNGSDLFLNIYTEKIDSIGGYVSYFTDNNKIINLFYSKYDTSQILIRMYFDSIPKDVPFKTESVTSKATKFENDLITMRMKVFRQIYEARDTSFKHYENANFNIIPVIRNNKKEVFVLTAPIGDSTILIGNDYLINFSQNNEILKKESLHNSMISLPIKGTNKIESTLHSHILSDFINSTDICTLLLNKEFVQWKSHIVMSKDYFSVFNLKDETLSIFTKEEFNALKKTENK